MKLFEDDITKNHLPYDGEVTYLGAIATHQQANEFFDNLMGSVEWRHDDLIIFGKHIVTKRKVAWYGDSNISYTYSGVTKKAFPWTRELLEIRKTIEHFCGITFNSCLLNLYHNGDEGISWHSDDEKKLDPNSPIASLSLGAERKFLFRHKKTNESVSIMLENGSLLLMKPPTQLHWQHRLPPSKKISSPRINLTFRNILIE